MMHLLRDLQTQFASAEIAPEYRSQCNIKHVKNSITEYPSTCPTPSTWCGTNLPVNPYHLSIPELYC